MADDLSCRISSGDSIVFRGIATLASATSCDKIPRYCTPCGISKNPSPTHPSVTTPTRLALEPCKYQQFPLHDTTKCQVAFEFERRGDEQTGSNSIPFAFEDP